MMNLHLLACLSIGLFWTAQSASIRSEGCSPATCNRIRGEAGFCKEWSCSRDDQCVAVGLPGGCKRVDLSESFESPSDVTRLVGTARRLLAARAWRGAGSRPRKLQWEGHDDFQPDAPQTSDQHSLWEPHRSYHRHRKIVVEAFIGIVTAPYALPQYIERRAAIRDSWLQELDTTRFAWKFVVGRSVGNDSAAIKGFKKEDAEFDDFLHLHVDDTYKTLPAKVYALFKAVVELYEINFLFKVDDDMYLQTDRLPQLLLAYKRDRVDYAGCMLQSWVHDDPTDNWYEPMHKLLPKDYFSYAWGPTYMLSRRALLLIDHMPPGTLRSMGSEDVMVGLWMLAFNMTHDDNRQLCAIPASDISLAVVGNVRESHAQVMQLRCEKDATRCPPSPTPVEDATPAADDTSQSS